MGKNKLGKKELSLPGKQSRNCDMNSSASGADKGKEHMHITDPKKKKKSFMEVSVKFMPMGKTSLSGSRSLARPAWKVTSYHRTKSTAQTKILCC